MSKSADLSACLKSARKRPQQELVPNGCGVNADQSKGRSVPNAPIPNRQAQGVRCHWSSSDDLIVWDRAATLISMTARRETTTPL